MAIKESRRQRLVLIKPRADVSIAVAGTVGTATLQESMYGPVLDALADHRIMSFGELEQSLEDKLTFNQLLQVVIVLTGTGGLHAVQDADVHHKAKSRTDKLNSYLIQKARTGNDVHYLASPITWGGIPVGRFQQLFLQAISQGKINPREWANHAWQLLVMQGHKIVKDGKRLATADENLAELTAQADIFAVKQLPILQALQIAPMPGTSN